MLNCNIALKRSRDKFLASLDEESKEQMFVCFDDFISDAFSFLKENDMSSKKDSIKFIMRHFFSHINQFTTLQRENIIMINEAILSVSDEMLFSGKNIYKNSLINSYIHDKITIMKSGIFFIANNAFPKKFK